jgi:hypothetical protein
MEPSGRNGWQLRKCDRRTNGSNRPIGNRWRPAAGFGAPVATLRNGAPLEPSGSMTTPWPPSARTVASCEPSGATATV